MGQASLDPRGRQGRGRPGTSLVLFACLLACPLLAACARYKKLSQGGSIPDVLMYDILGNDRAPSEYYQLVRTSHKDCDFCYRCGDDVFLVDKNIDAVQRLGRADFPRLEGQAEVIELLTEVLLEDCSALARSSAAGSLTKMGVKLPRYPGPPVEDDGSKLLRAMKELDAMHVGTCPRPNSEGTRRRTVALVTQIGNLDIQDYLTTKNAVRLFYGRPYLVNECDPAVRQAIDTALVKRLSALIRQALRGAVEDPVPDVRADAVRGLKTLGERGAIEVVLQRLVIEPSWLVRLEIAEYLGRVGTREGVVALVKLLDDANASVRHKARQSLTRVAGFDYGPRPGSWRHWAEKMDPAIEFDDGEADEDEDEG